MGEINMIRKKLIGVLCIVLCTSMLAAPLTGCKKNTVGTVKHIRDKHLDDEEDETEETDDETQTDNTSLDPDIVEKKDMFLDVTEMMVGVKRSDFIVSSGTDCYFQISYTSDEYYLNYTEYMDKDGAENVLNYTKDVMKSYVGPDARLEIREDCVVVDDDISGFYTDTYTYGTTGVVGNSYYSLYYYGTDLDKMWDFGNYIAACTGLPSPYNVLSGNPDLERHTSSDLSMEEVLNISRDTFGLDEYELAPSTPVDVDSLALYEEYNDDFCITIEQFNYSYNAYIYWSTYEEQAKKQFGNDLEVGDDYMFLKTKDPDYIYGGIWLSECYLIDIECYNDDYIDEVNKLIELLGLTKPASAVT